jgi:type IV pilus assembly protein PilC
VKKYNYEARDTTTNKKVKSVVQAESENAAAKLLMEQGFIPLNIVEFGKSNNAFSKLSNRIRTKDKIVFSRQLATLLGAGLPLTQSLRTVTEQTENKELRAVIDDIIVDIEGGKSLKDAFSKHPNVFDKVYLALVEAGETSGTIDDALKRIATQQEKDAAIVSKIKGALTYPIIVLVVIMGVMGFMLFTVVPQVEKLYADLRQELPLLTQLMVNASNFLASFWWLVLIVLGVGGYFFKQFIKTESGMKFMDTLKLNAPLFNGMFRRLYMARFARTGQTLLGTGVPMLDMLGITSEAVNNSLVGKSISHAADKVKGGKALSASLETEEYILPLVPQMIKIGEQSGKIDDMLGKTAQVYEDELDEEIRTISTIIEPALMVVLAIMAGGMIGAILFPIYSLIGNVGI